jgi:hypothetical protein
MHQSAVTVIAEAGRNTLGHDPALGMLSEMHHFGAGIGLLVIIGHCNGIKLAG